MNIPKIDPELLEISNKITSQKAKLEKEKTLKTWLSDKIVDIIALVISVIALIRTF